MAAVHVPSLPPAVKGDAGVAAGTGIPPTDGCLHCHEGDRAVIYQFYTFLGGLGCGLGSLPNENTVTTPESQTLGKHPSPPESQFWAEIHFHGGQNPAPDLHCFGIGNLVPVWKEFEAISAIRNFRDSSSWYCKLNQGFVTHPKFINQKKEIQPYLSWATFGRHNMDNRLHSVWVILLET